MTQLKLKQLVKLLNEWEEEFRHIDPQTMTHNPDEQPMYGEVIRLITAQVRRELED